MAAIECSITIATKPWEAARARFLDGLADTEKELFKDATAENLFYQASSAHKKYANSSRLKASIGALQPLVETISDLGDALDVYANASSAILCPLWGSIRVLLHFAKKCGNYFDKLIDMFSRIGDNLPRFRVFELLFPSHERLLMALSDVYLDLLNFCVEAKETFGRVANARISWLISLRMTWKPFQIRFASYLEKFRQHTEHVEKEAQLAHMIESKKAREAEEVDRALQEQKEKVERRQRLLGYLSTTDYRGAHQRLQDLREPDTGVWLLSEGIFLNWIKEPRPSCLCLYGIPGSGKTILSTNVFDTLLSAFKKPRSAACHFYCDYSDQSTLGTRNLFGGMIRQLMEQTDDTGLLEDSIAQTFHDGMFTPPNSVLVQLLLQALSSFDQVLVIIDGIDELPTDEQEHLVKSTNTVLDTPGITTKVLFTSRQESYARKLLDQYPSIELDATNVAPDIKIYVERAVDNMIDSGKLVLGSSAIRSEIISALCKGAKEMFVVVTRRPLNKDRFLWVRFQLYEICEAIGDAAIRKTLRDLPRDLSQTYLRILNRVWNSEGGEQKIALATKVFKWIMVVRRPLRIDELREAVTIEKTDRSLQTDRLDPGGGLRVIQACGNLATYDRRDRSVRLAHHTVQQFLTSAKQLLVGTSGFCQPFGYQMSRFDREQVETEIGEYCVAYLSFSDFETQVIPSKPSMLPIRPAPMSAALWNQISSSSKTSGLISLLFSPWRSAEQAPLINLNLARLKRWEQPLRVLQEKYCLLEYITSFWSHHASSLCPESVMWERFYSLTFDRQLTFGFRDWERPEYALSGAKCEQIPHLDLFRWALDLGFVGFVRLIAYDRPQNARAFANDSRGLTRSGHTRDEALRVREYYRHQVSYGDTHPLRGALEKDQVDLVRYLLRTIGDAYHTSSSNVFEVENAMSDGMLVQAAGRSSVGILSALVEECKVIFEEKLTQRARQESSVHFEHLRTPLELAVGADHAQAVRNLLEYAAQRNWNFTGRGLANLAEIAVRRGYSEIAFMLLDELDLGIQIKSSNSLLFIASDSIPHVVNAAVKRDYVPLAKAVLQHVKDCLGNSLSPITFDFAPYTRELVDTVVKEQKVELMGLLIEYGVKLVLTASPEVPPKRGDDPSGVSKPTPRSGNVFGGG
ncbi:MAG: hypothetical protein Q9157_001224 [Trypethelium eluteriae]